MRRRRGQILFSISRPGALANSEIDYAGADKFERESGSEKGSRAHQFQQQRESRNDAFRGGNCFLSSNHHNGNCRNNFLASPAADEVEEQRAHACLAQFGRVVLNDVLAAVAFVMEAVNKRLRFYGRPLRTKLNVLNIK